MTNVREAVQLQEPVPIRRIPAAIARRFFQICATAVAEAVAEADLTPLEFAVMAYLNPVDGEPDLDQRSLAVRLGVDRNTTSLLVRHLETKGLLQQRTNDADRRARLIRLTGQGEELFARLEPTAVAGQQQILAGLPPAQRELLLDLLLQVIGENQHLARPGAGRRKRNANGHRNTHARSA